MPPPVEVLPQPAWWAAPLVGLAGTLLGAAIALTASWIATSRQLRRSEAVARRDVYARFIERAVLAANAWRELLSLDAKADQLEERATTETSPEAASPEPDVLRELSALRDRAKVLSAAMDGYLEALLLAYYEVTLFAAKPIREGAARISEEMSNARGLQRRDGQSPAHNVRMAIADFTVLARADVGAPGARRVRTIVKRIDKLRAEEARGDA